METATVFGHNPDFTDFANRLSPEIGEMPTCTVLELAIDMKSWSMIGSTPPWSATLGSPKHV